MKIHSASTQKNKIAKVFSIFPLFGFAASLSLYAGKESISLLLLAISFGFLAVYTYFFSTHELYIDVQSRKVIKNIRWLFFRSTTAIPLKDYRSIVISLGRSVGKSNWHGITKTQTYDIALVHRYAVTNQAGGFSLSQNFPLKIMVKKPAEAKEIANAFSEQLGVDVSVDKEVTKFLGYDLLEYAQEF